MSHRQNAESFDEWCSATEIDPSTSDPEEMNDQRANWGYEALRGFVDKTGTDPDNALKYLLCDLMHWCDRHGQLFSLEIDAATRSYQEEISPWSIDGIESLPNNNPTKPTEDKMPF